MAQFISNQGYQNLGNGYEKEQSPFYKIADKYGEPPQSRTHHMESAHYYVDAKRTVENKWTLDMKKEEELGLMPKLWSQSSKMDDKRPNGEAMFDARFVNSPVPRCEPTAAHAQQSSSPYVQHAIIRPGLTPVCSSVAATTRG